MSFRNFWKNGNFFAIFEKKMAIFKRKNGNFLAIFEHLNGNIPEGQLANLKVILPSLQLPAQLLEYATDCDTVQVCTAVCYTQPYWLFILIFLLKKNAHLGSCPQRIYLSYTSGLFCMRKIKSTMSSFTLLWLANGILQWYSDMLPDDIVEKDWKQFVYIRLFTMII